MNHYSLCKISIAVVVAMLASATVSHAQVISNVITFTGDSLGDSTMTLSMGRNGELYGTSYINQTSDGSVFSLTTSGTATVLLAFNFTNGAGPLAGLTLATDGNFYGVTTSGGSFGYGVLFRISPSGIYTILHNFSGSDGAGPIAAPIQTSGGNLYGTTSGNLGIFPATIYEYSRAGVFSTVYSFDRAVAKNPMGLLQGSDGNLYGTAQEGGSADNGTVFKVSRSGKLLQYYSFPGGKLGAFPFGSLIQATDGNYYGITYAGGDSSTQIGGRGTIFKLNSKGAVSIVYSFKSAPDGAYPLAGLLQATDGYIYGTTANGGSFGDGTLFKINTSGLYTQLYSFDGMSGRSPVAAPMQHTNGLLYGTTEYGGVYDYGVVYSVNLGSQPFVTLVQPKAKLGQTVEILGQGFIGTSAVTFNGVSATNFSVKTDSYLTAVVPVGASSGSVVVTTPTATLTSSQMFMLGH